MNKLSLFCADDVILLALSGHFLWCELQKFVMQLERK